MACNRHLYTPRENRVIKTLDFGFKKYDNRGFSSKII